MALYNYKNPRTTITVLGHTAPASAAGTALASDKKSVQRSVQRRRFVGAVAHNKSTSSQALTVNLTATNGTATRTLDSTTIQKGDSAVWTDEEFGIDLDADWYVTMEITTSTSSPDVLYAFMKSADVM